MSTHAIAAFIGRFHGMYPAVPTPIDEAGEVDVPAIGRIVDYLVDGGVHGLWVLGSGGEFPMLSREQRRLVVREMVAAAAGRVPVVAGISGTCITAIEDDARAAADLGADAVAMIAPYYFHLRAADIRGYFERAADATKLPFVVYYNSHNSKIPLSLDLVRALADHPQIVGLKDASCDFAQHQLFCYEFADRGDFVVFQGDDRLMSLSFMIGGRGAVAAVPVIAPRLGVALYDAVCGGRIEEAHRLQRQCIDMLGLYELQGRQDDSSFLACQKAALEVLGLCTRRPVPPVESLDERFLPAVRKLLAEHDLLPSGSTAG